MPKDERSEDEGKFVEPGVPAANEEPPPLENADSLDDGDKDEVTSATVGERFAERGLSDADLWTGPEFRRRLASALTSPVLSAFREQQRRMANMVTPSIVRLIKQQQFVPRRFNVSAIKALESHQKRLNLLVSPSMLRAIDKQQRVLAELTVGSAFESLRQSPLQRAKLVSSPAAQALAKQQTALSAPTIARLQKSLGSTTFQKSYLTQVRPFTQAVSKVQLDPGWRVAIEAIRSSPEIGRWADLVANVVEAGPSSSAAAMDEATAAVASSEMIHEALSQAAEADIEPLEELIEITARAFEESVRTDGDPADGDVRLDRADAETYRALLKIWGVGNVVAIIVLACILSGQTLVILGSLAALAQLTGYSVKDLIRFLRDSDGDSE